MEQFWKVPFVRDVATMQVGRVIGMFSSFLASILYARFLGIGGYGQYAVVLAFTGTLGVLTNLGQQATLTTFLAEAYGRKDKEGMRIASHYYVSISVLAAFVLLVMMIIAPLVTDALYQKPEIGMLARLVFLSSLLEFPFSYVAISLQVVREIRMLTIAENAKVVVQLGLAVLLLIMGFGVAGILAGSAIGASVFALLSFVLYPMVRKKHNLPSFGGMLKKADTSKLWKHWKDGFWIAIDKNIGNLYPTIFLFVLSMITNQSVIGLLRLAFKLADLPASFVLNSVSRLSGSVLPSVAGRGADVLRSTIRKLVTHSAGAMALATIGALVCVPVFLPIVYGENFRVAVYPFVIIVIMQMSYAFHSFATPILRMYSKIYYATILNVITMSATVSILLIGNSLTGKPTWSLYAALGLFHTMTLLIIPPTLKLMKQKPVHT